MMKNRKKQHFAVRCAVRKGKGDLICKLYNTNLAKISVKTKKDLHFCKSHGGAYRIRTGDLYNANVARYQLC